MSVRLRKWTTKEGKSEEAWQVDFVFQHADGRKQRVVKFSPVQTRRGADAYERDLRNALLNGTFGKEKMPGEGSAPTLEQFTPRFLTFSENNNKQTEGVHVKASYPEAAEQRSKAPELEDNQQRPDCTSLAPGARRVV